MIKSKDERGRRRPRSSLGFKERERSRTKDFLGEREE